MMTLQGMADHRFTSVSLFTNVFLGEIIYLRPSLPLNAKNCYGLFEVLWKGLAAGCHSKKNLGIRELCTRPVSSALILLTWVSINEYQ